MRLAALAIAGVVILATEKFDVVVVLIEVEIEVAAALRAFQQAGEYAGDVYKRQPPTATSGAKILKETAFEAVSFFARPIL